VTGYRFFDNNRSEVIKNYPSNEGVFQNYFETARKGSPPINSSSVCIRKRCLVEIGGFPENVTLGEDLLTWAKLAAKYKIAYSALPKTNIQFPLTISSQTTFRVPDRIDYVGNSLITLLESMAEKRTHISLKKYIGHWYKMRMTLFVLKGEKQNVAREFRKIIMINPFNLKAYLWFFIGILPKTARSLFINRFLSNTFK